MKGSFLDPAYQIWYVKTFGSTWDGSWSLPKYTESVEPTEPLVLTEPDPYCKCGIYRVDCDYHKPEPESELPF